MKKLLLVEDEKDSAKTITKLLRNKGYSVISAYTGQQALEFLNEQDFDLAIIDLILPDMYGYDICAVIRHNSRLKSLPIIISTAVGTAANRSVGKEMAISEFLVKPYRIEDLLQAISRCLNSE